MFFREKKSKQPTLQLVENKRTDKGPRQKLSYKKNFRDVL